MRFDFFVALFLFALGRLLVKKFDGYIITPRATGVDRKEK